MTTQIPTRTLGSDAAALTVSALGLGCMGMSIAYGEAMDQGEAVKLLHAALDRGVDHFDTAELYGFGANEELLGAAFHDRRDKAFIATKFGPVGDLSIGKRHTLNRCLGLGNHGPVANVHISPDR